MQRAEPRRCSADRTRHLVHIAPAGGGLELRASGAIWAAFSPLYLQDGFSQSDNIDCGRRPANYCPRPRSSQVNMRAPANPTAKGIQSSKTPSRSASNATDIMPSNKSARTTAKSPRASTRTTRTRGLSMVCHIRFGRASEDPGGMISGATLGRCPGGIGRRSVISHLFGSQSRRVCVASMA
jgi:hypothetical protein